MNRVHNKTALFNVRSVFFIFFALTLITNWTSKCSSSSWHRNSVSFAWRRWAPDVIAMMKSYRTRQLFQPRINYRRTHSTAFNSFRLRHSVLPKHRERFVYSAFSFCFHRHFLYQKKEKSKKGMQRVHLFGAIFILAIRSTFGKTTQTPTSGIYETVDELLEHLLKVEQWDCLSVQYEKHCPHWNVWSTAN